VVPGTGLHPRPPPADDLVQYFARPQRANESATTTELATAPEATADAQKHTHGSYIDPRWKPTSLVTRKGESIAEFYGRCEEFLRAFVGRIDGRDPRPSVALPGGVGTVRSGSGDKGVGVGHARILLVSHAATVIGLARALTGDGEVVRVMRVGCCTLTALCRSPSWTESPPSSSTTTSQYTPTSTPTLTLGGREVWAVRGTPADGSFLSGGVERSWGMADVETHAGVVVEDAGVPGSEAEADGPTGLQVWWTTGTVPASALSLPPRM
jgi:transcription factor C subunit 7